MCNDAYNTFMVSLCACVSSVVSVGNAGAGNGHQSSSVSRDANSVKAQINGILHEDSLPYYDQLPPPAAPSRQGSAALPQALDHLWQSPTASPRLRLSQGTAPTRLSTQGSHLDLGDLGVSSPSGQMSRANSRDTGHIPTFGPTQHASGSWQGRLSRSSVDPQQLPGPRQSAQTHFAPGQRTSSPQQGSAYAAIESMLSSIPETLSGMPSMPAMPSVPSMADIEKSMQSGWSSFTGSLGVAPAAALSQPHQLPTAQPSGWVAFANDASALPTSSPPAEYAVSGMPAVSQPAPPISTAASQQNGGLLSRVSSGFPHSVSLRAADRDGGSSGGHSPLASPRKKPTGLQSIDPLTAVKEAASVPLRAMSSGRQDSLSEASSHRSKSASLAMQASTNTGSHAAEDASIPPMDACPSSDWSEFTAAQTADHTLMQPLPREVTQPSNASQPLSTSSGANADMWAQFSMPANVQAPPGTSDAPTAPVSAGVSAPRHSLLDM